ncbi:hypothetical protein CHU98_g9692 [Xylaria longipes]|nr:hypothetical protein CHU98_g9692 [Xylaria longipes]
MVYSLLGIFGVFLPLIYGEGKDHAHRRLRSEVEKLPTQKPQPVAFHPTDIVVKPETFSLESSNFCNECKKHGYYANEPHCYECGEYGHFAAAHRSQEVCSTCGEYGHYKPDCPEDDDSDLSDSEESDY